MGAADEDTNASAHSQRLAKWARDSADLHAASAPPGDPDVAPEVAAMARYRRSRTSVVRLPHPHVSPRRYDALATRRRELTRRTAVLLVLAPVLVVLGVVLDPLALQVAIWALLLPTAGIVVHHRRAVRAIDHERHITLRGSVADAWSDWLAARDSLAELDGATHARAALAVSEDRMHSLVLSMSEGSGDPGAARRSPGTDDATRDWIHRQAATATALAVTEQRLALDSRRQVDDAILALPPADGLDPLEQALHTARSLATDDPRT